MNRIIFILSIFFAINAIQHTSPISLWETPKFLREKFEKLFTSREVDNEVQILHRWRWDSQVNPTLQLNNPENMVALGVASAKKLREEKTKQELDSNYEQAPNSDAKFNLLCNRSSIQLAIKENEQPVGNDVIPAEIVMMILLQAAKGNELFDSMSSLTSLARAGRAYYRFIIDESTMSHLLKRLLGSMKECALVDLKEKIVVNEKPPLLPEFKFLIEKLLTLINGRPENKGKIGSEEKNLRILNKSWQESLELLLPNGLSINHVLYYDERNEAQTLLSKALLLSNVEGALLLLNHKVDLQDYYTFYVPGYQPGNGLAGNRGEFYEDAIKKLVNAGLSPNALVTGGFGIQKNLKEPFLAFAIAIDSLSLARFLIENGANIDQKYTAEDARVIENMTPRQFAQNEVENDPAKQAFIDLFDHYKINEE